MVLEAIRGEKCLGEIASQYGVHPNQIAQWRKKALNELPQVLSRKGERNQEEKDGLVDELYRQIGQLKVELDWLKKKSQGFG